MKRFICILGLGAMLAFLPGQLVAHATSTEPAGDPPTARACADVANPADATLPATGAGFSSIDPASGVSAPTVSAQLSLESPSCRDLIYTLHVLGVDSQNPPQPTTELTSERILGNGVDQTLQFDTHLPASAAAAQTVCVYFTVSGEDGRLDRSPTQPAGSATPACIQFSLDSAGGHQFA